MGVNQALRVCFRLDASTEVGMGHLVESLALAQSLKKAAECQLVFVIKDYPPAEHVLGENGYRVEVLRKDISENEETAETRRIAGALEAEVLVCDLFDKPDSYYRALMDRSRRLVVVLDDEELRAVTADVVVNFNIVQKEEFYRGLPPSGTIYYVGPAYMPLPDDLHEEWKREKAIPRTCRRILVLQGGSDLARLTDRIIKALEALDLEQEAIVLVGPAVSPDYKRELESLIPRLRNSYRFEWGVPPEQVRRFMAEGDLAITAAGNTLYELAVFGVPSITVCQQSRQLMVAREFARRGAVVNLGIGSAISPDTIAGAVKSLLGDAVRRRELSRNIKAITDGCGGRRVADIIVKR